MTLAGTRPPLIGEVSEYELHHRARLAIKPGITGMWQVNSLVSMNMWGLTPDFLDVLEEGFKEFFEKEVPGNPLKAEYLIPIFIGELLEQGKMSESTFYRVLREEKMLNHRGRSEAPKKNRPSTYHATASNQVYMWDITYLNGPHKGMFYYLYGN